MAISKDSLQKQALNAFNNHYFEEHNTRGTLVACCGYGKSRTIYKCIQSCIEKGDISFIISTSRIILLNQLIDDMQKQNSNIEIKSWGDGNCMSEWGVTNFLQKPHPKILITTYNSASKIVNIVADYNKNLKDNNAICIDLVVLDEAHNTCGDDKFHQDLIKPDSHFMSSKYLFVTATPLINENKKFNMNDNEIYGKEFYNYSFSQGINDNIICNFNVINGKCNDFDDMAIFLIENMIKYNLKKNITYLSSKENVEQFENYINKYCFIHNIDVNVFSMLCTDSTKKRQDKENIFVSSRKISIILSVGIYNEGVDLPCVDSVLFAEPRSNKKTIIQNIGRCLRLYPGKLMAYVLLPIKCKTIMKYINELKKDVLSLEQFKTNCTDLRSFGKNHTIRPDIIFPDWTSWTKFFFDYEIDIEELFDISMHIRQYIQMETKEDILKLYDDVINIELNRLNKNVSFEYIDDYTYDQMITFVLGLNKKMIHKLLII